MEEGTNITFDKEGILKQSKEEIRNTEHSLVFEVILPPIEPKEAANGSWEITSMPIVTFEANNGCSPMTEATLLRILEQVIAKQLKEVDIKLAYTLLKSGNESHSFINTNDIGGEN